MSPSIEANLNLISQNNMESKLRIGKVGIEKESLRTDKRGVIANSDHPGSLGSALMHPYITTDYSEALLEFVTPPLDRRNKNGKTPETRSAKNDYRNLQTRQRQKPDGP